MKIPEMARIYFWTATINSWYHLLESSIVKEIIIASLQYLSSKGKIKVYAFVIMPNHIHLILGNAGKKWKGKRVRFFFKNYRSCI